VILLSARAGEEPRIEGLEAGADEYLHKPFSARELVARVESRIELTRLRRRLEADRESVLREEADTRTALSRVGKAVAGELDLDRIMQTVTDAATQLSGARDVPHQSRGARRKIAACRALRYAERPMRGELLFTFLFAGALLVGLGVPLLRGKVPPNGLYGVRIRATFEDRTVWYEANRMMGRDLVLVGAATLFIALVSAGTEPIGELAATLVCVSILTIGALVAAARSILFANRRYRELHGAPPHR
jgi:CheY-like chemotaxis protein